MRFPPALIAVALLTCAAVMAACGGDDGDSGTPAPPVASPADFPRAEGKTLARLRAALPPGGPVLVPSVSELTTGKNRFGFGLFDRSRAQIADASVALYVAPVGGGPASGPHIARFESLEVGPHFRSQTSASDPDEARSVYAAELPFEAPGRYEVLGVARLDDRLVAASPTVGGVVVMSSSEDQIPGPGDRVPRIETPTEADVAGDLASIDTRTPPSSMHEENFADVVGKRPVILLFATPALCQTRVCGPVVDVAEQVKAELEEDDVAFIHMEVYRDNRVENGLRPQLAAFRLQTEPWAFAIDRRGRVVARLEGAFGAGELKDAVAAARGR